MRSIPRHIHALLAALKFTGDGREALRVLHDSEWENLLARWDFQRLIIPLRLTCSEYLPDWVRSRIDVSISDNAKRFDRIKAVYSEASNAIQEAGAEHVVLKGFAHGAGFVPHPRFRLQSDIDFFCPPDSIFRAREALESIGYEPIMENAHLPCDHLPSMIKKTKWEWRGNPYDADIPVSLELHFCFWNKDVLRFGPHGLSDFWLRRVERQVDNISFPALNSADTLGYAALQVLRDMLSGDSLSYKVYELARFLHTHAGDQRFWNDWRASHDDSMRSLESISFRLARDWFSCGTPEQVEEEIDRQPATVKKWFQKCGDSPLIVSLHPNKDALWLHSSLVESGRARRSVLREGLLPKRIPPVDATYIQKPIGNDPGRRISPLRKRTKYVAYVLSRATYHTHLLPPTLWRGVQLWWSGKSLSPQFWVFMAASFLFDFGMFIFFLLYNLYLLDRGAKESFLGLVTSAIAIGSIAGTIPAGLLAQRLGLRKSLLLCFALVSGVASSLALVTPGPILLLFAFLAGAALSIWAVSISPVIARLTTERSRPFGFSLVFSSGVGVGILGGLAGGRLPGLIARIEPSGSAIHAKQVALLVGCAVVALGLWPVSRLRFSSFPVRERKLYPRNPFLLRFLPAIAIWSLVTGSFSPFFNAYFSQHLRVSVDKIGVISSGSQLAQVLAMLMAPVIFRKFGLVSGVAGTQIATALALGCLAASTARPGAFVAYASFSAFLWMSEPGMYSLLMNRLAPAEHAGASALNFLVISGAQAIAALLAGLSFARFGYPVVLCVIAGVALLAALMSWRLLGSSARSVRLQVDADYA